MKPSPLVSLLLLTSSLFFASCATPPPPLSEAERGRRYFQRMQEAVIESTAELTPSIAYVIVQTTGSAPRSYSIGGTSISSTRSRDKKIAGWVLDQEGHILVAMPLKPDQIGHTTVWINQEEHHARLVKTDEGLGMSILKIESDQPLQPIDLSAPGKLVPGAWAVSLSPSGDDRDFIPSQELGFCSGLNISQFTGYNLTGARMMIGAPVVNIEGELAGIATGSTTALSIAETSEDIKELLAHAAQPDNGESNDEEDNSSKGWLGIVHAPINPDYAIKYDLPRGAIRINHVTTDSPAHQAGVKAGDLIVQANGKDVRFSNSKAFEYFIKVLRARKGKPFSLVVMRDQERLTLDGTFGEPPKPDTLRVKSLGVSVRNIDSSLAISERLATDQGVYISSIEKGSPAAMGDDALYPGDVITAVANQPTTDLTSFNAVIEKLRESQASVVLVAYTRERITGYAALNLNLGEQL